MKPVQFTKEQITEFKEDRAEVYENLFDEYINSNDDDRTKIKFESINNNIEVLNLPNNKDVLIKYKEYIMDDKKKDKHMNIIRLLKSDEYIKMKLDNVQQQNQKVKTLDNIYNKISVLRNYERSFFLKPIQVNYKIEKEIDIPDKDWALIKKLFRTTREKPKNMSEFKIAYIQMIKNITDNDLITTTQERKMKSFYVFLYDETYFNDASFFFTSECFF